jgi:hypothetical protein
MIAIIPVDPTNMHLGRYVKQAEIANVITSRGFEDGKRRENSIVDHVDVVLVDAEVYFLEYGLDD